MLMPALLCVLLVREASSIYQWSHQQSLFVPHAAKTYGQMPSMLTGRGFMTMITGYDPVNPGLFIHTTEDGHLHRNGQVVWSQQGKLVVPGVLPSDQFGKTMVAWNQTLIVAAPYRSRGMVFVFNGSRKHWSLIQTLRAPDFADNDYFGEAMALEDNRLVIASKGQLSFSGCVYVFERPVGGMVWSRTAKLTARDAADNAFLGRGVALYGNTVAATAMNDNLGDAIPATLVNPEADARTGAGYLFQYNGGIWSQQQKLTALEFINYYKDGLFREGLDLSLGERKLGPDIGLNADSVAIGVTNVNPDRYMRQPVYIFGAKTSKSWSLQQKLLFSGDPYDKATGYFQANIKVRENTMIMTAPSRNTSATYIFKTFAGRGWSLQQKITAWTAQDYTTRVYNETTNVTTVTTNRYLVKDPYNTTDMFLAYNTSVPRAGIERELLRSFSSPAMWGGYLMHNAGPHGGVQIRSQFRNDSCLVLWMSDHFLDGWDTAVLTVRAPDRTNDSFHPHCDQIDPFRVRYCPYQPTDEGIYIVKVFAAIAARFYWELSWQVTIEATGETFRGDFGTKMEFNFNATSSTFSLASIQNEVDLESFCFRCTRVAFLTWSQLQIPGNSAFWPLVVTGAPYYISDYNGRSLAAAGKVCEGITTYECYQTLVDGIYLLRLGGGLFGRITGYPMANASWHGCGERGGVRDQLVFRIGDGKCTPIQKFRYNGRCAVPPIITNAEYADSGVRVTPAPSYGGTVKPTVSVFGSGKGAAGNAHRQRSAEHLVLNNNVAATDSAMEETGFEDSREWAGTSAPGMQSTQFPSEAAESEAAVGLEPTASTEPEDGAVEVGEEGHGDGLALLGQLLKRPAHRQPLPQRGVVDANAQDVQLVNEDATPNEHYQQQLLLYPEEHEHLMQARLAESVVLEPPSAVGIKMAHPADVADMMKEAAEQDDD